MGLAARFFSFLGFDLFLFQFVDQKDGKKDKPGRTIPATGTVW